MHMPCGWGDGEEAFGVDCDLLKIERKTAGFSKNGMICLFINKKIYCMNII